MWIRRFGATRVRHEPIANERSRVRGPPEKARKAMPAPLNVCGERFGRLVALVPIGSAGVGKAMKRLWRFKCDCGAEVVRKLSYVRNGDTQSCGCQKTERSRVWGQRSRLEKGESSFRSLFASYISRAKRSGQEFSLSADDFRGATSGNCAYCGIEPRQERLATHDSYGTYVYNGLDRVDNSKGYTKGNVVPACAICNRAKGVMSREEFVAWIKRAAAHL